MTCVGVGFHRPTSPIRPNIARNVSMPFAYCGKFQCENAAKLVLGIRMMGNKRIRTSRHHTAEFESLLRRAENAIAALDNLRPHSSRSTRSESSGSAPTSFVDSSAVRWAIVAARRSVSKRAEGSLAGRLTTSRSSTYVAAAHCQAGAPWRAPRLLHSPKKSARRLMSA
jgi:hypothetical protein